MFSRRHRHAVLISGLAFTACTQDNPSFVVASETADTRGPDATGATGEPGATTGGDPGSGSDGEPATTDGTMMDPSPTTGVATTTGVTPGSSGAETGATAADDSAASTTTTGESSTTESEPVVMVIPAEVGTCVLLANPELQQPHAPPAQCESISAALSAAGSSVMALDTTLKNGGGAWREARIFLKFVVPAAPDGKLLTAAVLTMEVDAGMGSAGLFAGALFAAAPFGIDDLEGGAPPVGDLRAGADSAAIPGQAVSWPFQYPDVIVSDAPLFLAMIALDDDGVVFRSTSAGPDLGPVLTLSFE